MAADYCIQYFIVFSCHNCWDGLCKGNQAVSLFEYTHFTQNDCQLCIYQDDSNTYYAVGLAMGIHVIWSCPVHINDVHMRAIVYWFEKCWCIIAWVKLLACVQ